MKELPYKIACLCYLFDVQERVLLIHRHKQPNLDLYSPIGGKLETTTGESPKDCAVREIHEEAGILLAPEDLHLTGVVSETAFNQETHWLMFLFEATLPVSVTPTTISEGRLDWHALDAIDKLPLPESDRQVIWPQFLAHRGGFFAAHLDCRVSPLVARLDQSLPKIDLGANSSTECSNQSSNPLSNQ